MSRIGKSPITIPEGVNVDFKDGFVTVKGKLGELKQEINDIEVNVEDNVISFERSSEKSDQKAKHGLYRALVNNMIEGVTNGFTKELELVGVGYRASNQGQKLDLAVGYSHNIVIDLAPEVKVETISEKGKNLADRAKKAGVETISFDRGGYLYHGRVKSLAEGAREGGLKF